MTTIRYLPVPVTHPHVKNDVTGRQLQPTNKIGDNFKVSLSKILYLNFNRTLIILLNFLLLIISPLFGESWTPELRITNGTTSQPGMVEGVRIISIAESMQPIGEIPGFNGKLKIENINFPETSPILFQAKYKGAIYNKMVPPAPIFRQKPIEIVVYEPNFDLSTLDIKSVIQINREDNYLRFIKVYIFNNRTEPKKSYILNPPLEIFVPEDVEELRGQYTQPESQMGIPLALDKGKDGRKFERAILPGQSDLVITYKIPSKKDEITNIEDRILFEKEDGKVFLLNPPNMNLRGRDLVSNFLDENGPDGMKGLKIIYKDKKATLEIVGGNPIAREPENIERKIVNGSIFTNWMNSTYGVLAVLGILFSLSFIFVYKKNNDSV